MASAILNDGTLSVDCQNLMLSYIRITAKITGYFIGLMIVLIYIVFWLLFKIVNAVYDASIAQFTLQTIFSIRNFADVICVILLGFMVWFSIELSYWTKRGKGVLKRIIAAECNKQ
uniref:Uncharacterized protein n=1 Tax=viral metagenome TaxID=1070528 RepID=A0A6C0CPU0_9ZZZZ